MVTIPSGPSVPLQPTQATRFSSPSVVPVQDATGRQIQQLGAATTQVAVQLGRLQQERQDRRNITFARELDAKYRATDTEDVDRFLALRGKDADDAFPGLLQSFDERTKAMLDEAENDEQRAMLELSRAQRREDFTSRAFRHYQGEVRRRESTAAEASEALSRSDAVTYFQDPQGDERQAARNQDLLNKAQADAIAKLRVNGVDTPEAIRAARLDVTTFVHSGRIDQMIADGNLDAAETYLGERRKDEIAPGTATDLQEKIRRAKAVQQSQREAFDTERQAAVLEIEMERLGLNQVESKQYLDSLLTSESNPISGEVHRLALTKRKSAIEAARETKRNEDNDIIDGLSQLWQTSTWLEFEDIGEDNLRVLDERALRHRAMGAFRSIRAEQLKSRLEDPEAQVRLSELRDFETIQETRAKLEDRLNQLKGSPIDSAVDLAVSPGQGKASQAPAAAQPSDAATKRKIEAIEQRLKDLSLAELVFYERRRYVGEPFAGSADDIDVGSMFWGLLKPIEKAMGAVQQTEAKPKVTPQVFKAWLRSQKKTMQGGR